MNYFIFYVIAAIVFFIWINILFKIVYYLTRNMDDTVSYGEGINGFGFKGHVRQCDTDIVCLPVCMIGGFIYVLFLWKLVTIYLI